MNDFQNERCREFISQNRWKEAADFVSSVNKTNSENKSISPGYLENIADNVRSDYLAREGGATFLLEIIRILRNLSTTYEKQQCFVNCLSLISEVKAVFQKVLEQNDHVLLTKILLQFLVNLIVSNKEAAIKISENFYEDVLKCFHQKKNEYEVLALMYNLHIYNTDLGFEESLYEEILQAIIDENSCEYHEFLAELFLYKQQFWSYYRALNISQRIVVLQLLKKLWTQKKLNEIPESALQILSERFSNSSSIIFQTVCSDDPFLESHEVSLLLDSLSCLCSEERYLVMVQNDKELLIRSCALLINIHRLGKQSQNYFSSMQKLSDLKNPNDVIKNHPAFGFKVGLVKLIANLCWKNKKLQDLVREAEVIPVLLDCCNIDARNPLIMQWVILAIRNLCDKNLDNQAIIAGLHKEGTLSTEVIEEMGLTLCDNGSQGIRIVPLDLKR